MKFLCHIPAVLFIFAGVAPAAEPMPPVKVEISTVPAQPAVLNSCQILVSAFGAGDNEAMTGKLSVEIRPVSQKIRQLGSEWYRNVRPFEPGRMRILHNFRIAGDYELTARLETSGGTYETTRRINVVDNGEVGFWSETGVKSALFVLMMIGLFLLAGRFAVGSKPAGPDNSS